MGALVVVLVVTNVASLATLVLLIRRHRTAAPPADTTDVLTAPRPAGVTGRDRQLITIEILNPIELATARGGRVAGVAGALAPGLTRRLVYDQTLRTLRRELDGKRVRADVRMHTLRAVPRRPTRPAATGAVDSVVEGVIVDEVAPLDLRDLP